MSTDPKLFSPVDEFEDPSYSSSFRIPPLQDPLPYITTSRPLPLEPNARVNDSSHNATAKLTSRRKALAEAKLIGENDTGHSYEATIVKQNIGVVRSIEGSEKGQQVDNVIRVNEFVQLPKPTAAVKEARPPPFQPVAVLTELHEPPPSAALFPPITSNQSSREESLPKLDPRLVPEILIIPGNRSKLSDQICNSPKEDIDQDAYGPIKRAVLRPRKKWTEEETHDLLKGVSKFGPGKWKKILNDPELYFSSERTTVDLKDRYRTCRMNQEKDIIRCGSLHNLVSLPDLVADGSSSTAEQTDFEAANLTSSSTPSQTSSSVLRGMRSTSAIDGSRNFVSGPVNINIPWLPPTKTRRPKDNQPKPPQPYKPHRTLPPRWTKEEDENLIKGHKKYGFSWTAITKDPEMQLSHRLGAQVRDRFRLKFSELYQAAPPSTGKKQVKPQPKYKSAKEKSDVGSSLEPTAITRTFKRCRTGSHVDASDEGRKITRAKLRDTPLSPRPDTLPAELETATRVFDHHCEQDLRCESVRDVRSELQGQPQGVFSEILHYSDERSRQSSVTADDARHLGILGLLNDEEEEEVSRLPPFKYPYEDWGEDSVTLPPLLWEDMAARPMFDLE
ncbi:hypothetical protein MMC26_005279 [Xylographa opegraphella]|nr:hypothetical protein [Xylographa opegraphella]